MHSTRKNGALIIYTCHLQIAVSAFISMTVFFRTRLNQDSVGSASLYLNALFYAVIVMMFTGFGELAATIGRLPVLIRQRDMLFAPAWTYSVSAMVLSVPLSVLMCGIFTGMTYYVTGYSPDASRFFKQFLLLFLIQQQAGGMFRFVGGVCRTITLGFTLGWILILLIFMLGGFIMPRPQLPIWWRWGYWTSSMSYSVNSIAVNEFRDERWNKVIYTDDCIVHPHDLIYCMYVCILMGSASMNNCSLPLQEAARASETVF